MTLVNSAAICVPDNFLLAVSGNLAMVSTKWSKPTDTESIELSTLTLKRFFKSSMLFLLAKADGAEAPPTLAVATNAAFALLDNTKLSVILLAPVVDGPLAVTTIAVPLAFSQAA